MTQQQPALPKIPALLSGLILLVMTALAIVSLLTWMPELYDATNAEQTLLNYQQAPQLFSFFNLAVIAIIVLDIVLGYTLFRLFPGTKMNVAMAAARVLYGLAFLAALWPLLRFSGDNAGVLQSAWQSFEHNWMLSLAIFGVHLVLLGRLFCARSGWVSKALAIACTVAGVAYIVDGISLLLLAPYATTLANYVGWAELLVMLYLIGIAMPFRRAAH